MNEVVEINNLDNDLSKDDKITFLCSIDIKEIKKSLIYYNILIRRLTKRMDKRSNTKMIKKTT